MFSWDGVKAVGRLHNAKDSMGSHGTEGKEQLNCAMELYRVRGVFQEIRKYPPAKPGALRLLAPQRGLIAIGNSKSKP